MISCWFVSQHQLKLVEEYWMFFFPLVRFNLFLISACALVSNLSHLDTFLFSNVYLLLSLLFQLLYGVSQRWSSYQYWFFTHGWWIVLVWASWARAVEEAAVWLTKALLFSAWVDSQTSLLESLHWGLKWAKSLNIGQLALTLSCPLFSMLIVLFCHLTSKPHCALLLNLPLLTCVFLPLPYSLSLFPSNCQVNFTKLLKSLKKCYSSWIIDLWYDR